MFHASGTLKLWLLESVWFCTGLRVGSYQWCVGVAGATKPPHSIPWKSTTTALESRCKESLLGCKEVGHPLCLSMDNNRVVLPHLPLPHRTSLVLILNSRQAWYLFIVCLPTTHNSWWTPWCLQERFISENTKRRAACAWQRAVMGCTCPGVSSKHDADRNSMFPSFWEVHYRQAENDGEVGPELDSSRSAVTDAFLGLFTEVTSKNDWKHQIECCRSKSPPLSRNQRATS